MVEMKAVRKHRRLGDVDGSDLASIDVTYILRYLSELPTPYPIDGMTDIVC